jgi:hypothetical protein
MLEVTDAEKESYESNGSQSKVIETETDFSEKK